MIDLLWAVVDYQFQVLMIVLESIAIEAIILIREKLIGVTPSN